MRMTLKRAALIAALVYVLLFLFRFFFPGPGGFEPMYGGPVHAPMNQASGEAFELGRKNYASSKALHGFGGGGTMPAGAPAASPESQKYEKIGTLVQTTHAFEDDRKRTEQLVAAQGGIVQLERAAGLTGWRFLHLGIGVPPDKFDGFVEAARAIGRNVGIEIVKNDKTNDYLQLKAKRATLEKARTALEDLRAGGGSTSERVGVQNRLTEIEQQIQDLGVSLGEFDSQNELCTVKLTLREVSKPVAASLAWRAFRAFETALMDYLALGVGFFGLMLGLWLATVALREGTKLWQRYGTAA